MASSSVVSVNRVELHYINFYNKVGNQDRVAQIVRKKINDPNFQGNISIVCKYIPPQKSITLIEDLFRKSLDLLSPIEFISLVS